MRCRGSGHRCRSVCRGSGRRWRRRRCRRRRWRWGWRVSRGLCGCWRGRVRWSLGRYRYRRRGPSRLRSSPRLRAVVARRHRRGRQDRQQADPDDPTGPPLQTTECEEDVSHCVAILPTMPGKSMTPKAYGVSAIGGTRACPSRACGVFRSWPP